jgi:hypothetical protein
MHVAAVRALNLTRKIDSPPGLKYRAMDRQRHPYTEQCADNNQEVVHLLRAQQIDFGSSSTDADAHDDCKTVKSVFSKGR